MVQGPQPLRPLSAHAHPRGSAFAVASAWDMPSSYHKPSLFLSFRAPLECHLFLEALSGCHLLLGDPSNGLNSPPPRSSFSFPYFTERNHSLIGAAFLV